MKTGSLIGYFGCVLWLVSLFIRDKAYEVTQVIVGVVAILLLVVATITVGVQKQRTWLGVALSPLTIIFGLGFIIVMLVPKKELHHAA